MFIQDLEQAGGMIGMSESGYGNPRSETGKGYVPSVPPRKEEWFQPKNEQLQGDYTIFLSTRVSSQTGIAISIIGLPSSNSITG